MKARLLRNPNKAKKQKRLRIVLAAAAFIVLGMMLPKTLSFISSIIIYPFHATSIWLEESSSLIPTFFRERTALDAEIKELENELLVANKADLTQQRLFEENHKLRGLLGFTGEERVAAAVIARPNELPYDLLQIDRGSNHGIEVGAPVFVGKDVVIGLVAHVASDYSFVQMVTSPKFQASAFIGGPNVVVTMEGVGGGVARVRVPQGVPLSVGNMVYLPSVEPGVFGRVSYVENRPTQPEQYGYIAPDIPVSSLYLVSVGRLSQISQSITEIDERILELMKESLLVEHISVGEIGTTSSSTVGE